MENIPGLNGRRGRQDRDWTQGNIFRNLLMLAWPMLISNTLMMIGPTIDMLWIGRLGSAAIAGPALMGVVGLISRRMLMPPSPTPQEVAQVGHLAARVGIASIFFLFAAGAVLFHFVDEQKGVTAPAG